MSCYIVENKTINTIVTKLMGDKPNGMMLDEVYYGSPEALATKLLELNVSAVNLRYSDAKESIDDIEDKDYTPTEESPVQTIKALSCFCISVKRFP